MGTSWEEIEARAMTYIKNDESLNFDMAYRLPVFYNRMTAYMKEAIPLFNRPVEMLTKLSSYTTPTFEDMNWTAEEDFEAPVTIETEANGFQICAVGTISEDDFGNPIYTPFTAFSFDENTGTLTINANLSAGTELVIDLYGSGSFEAELTETEKGILAFCIYNVYEHRFDNNVLERTAKIRDSSFTTISEASQTAANTSRQKHVDEELYGMLRAYEVNAELMYRKNRGLMTWQT